MFDKKDIRMDDIIKELGAEEFIQFIKDNKINYLLNLTA